MEDNEFETGEGDGGPDENNNSNLNKTNPSEKARRNYPKHVKGQKKNEWIGIVHHQQEIQVELGKVEKEIKILTANTLNTEYEKNLIAMYEKKKKGLLLKQKEGEEMLEKRNMYQQDLTQFKQDKIMMQNHMTEVYNQSVQEKHDIRNNYKSAEMDIERAILEDNYRKMEQKQREMLEKKEKEKMVAQSALQDKERIKLQQNFDQLKTKNEVNEMNKMSEMRGIIKEENYKNFFKICADNQAYYQDLHRSQVLNPLMEKQEKIQNFIEKNVSEENKKKFNKELERLKKKQDVQ